MSNGYFTKEQSELLEDFAADVSGGRATGQMDYHVLGIADLADSPASTALVEALQQENWKAASEHHEIAGRNNLLVALLLRVRTDAGLPGVYWLAMRAPFELLESARLVTWGKVRHEPAVIWTPLFKGVD